ncbi:MAG: helix-turn-helix domain-containing protein [Dehalococcoidia bacterium]|nr:helix-turn-helix domain-containing protein [Dehalococcoidia bacterium]
MAIAVKREVYSTNEAAVVLGVCAQTIRNMCNAGTLPCIKLGLKGGRTLIPARVLDNYLTNAYINMQKEDYQPNTTVITTGNERGAG